MSEKEYQKDLLKAFVKCKKADWESKIKYTKYKELSKAYLKGKAGDAIEEGKLIVDLTRATLHLFEVIKDGEKEKTKETKRTKELVSHRRVVPQLSGSDEGQAEGKGTEEVPNESQGG